MRSGRTRYQVFTDGASRPRMYGIRGGDGVQVGRISTDFQEVYALVQRCNTGGLSPLHLRDVVEDFRRG